MAKDNVSDIRELCVMIDMKTVQDGSEAKAIIEDIISGTFRKRYGKSYISSFASALFLFHKRTQTITIHGDLGNLYEIETIYKDLGGNTSDLTIRKVDKYTGVVELK